MHDLTQLEDLCSRLSGGHAIDRKDIEAVNRITGSQFPLTDTPDEGQREAMLGAVQEGLKRARASRVERKHDDRG